MKILLLIAILIVTFYDLNRPLNWTYQLPYPSIKMDFSIIKFSHTSDELEKIANDKHTREFVK